MESGIGLRSIASLILCSILIAACGGGGGNRASPPPLQPQPGSLQLSVSAPSIDEGAGKIDVTITRTGGSDGAVSVTVSSSAGSATADQDYVSLNTTVTFAAGTATSKTLSIAVAEDTDAESDETLALALSAPTGGATLGAQSAATLTIVDNDAPAAPNLAVSADVKQLKFSWAGVAGATRYRLLQSQSGSANFTPLGADHPADATNATVDIAVHRLDWLNARYRLEACNKDRCSSSSPISALDSMLTAIAFLTEPTIADDAGFGTSVALSSDGNTLAVGAPFESAKAGAVYVFVRTGTQWSPPLRVSGSNTEADDFFGFALDLSDDGSTLAVGALGEASAAQVIDGNQIDNSAAQAGAVYVFARNGEQWPQQAYLKAANAAADNRLGFAVALSADGNTLATGAPHENEQRGAAHVFTRSGTQWSEHPPVLASNADKVDQFGFALALSADGATLAVSAPAEDSAARDIDGNQADNTAPAAGAAYVFQRSGAAWTQEAYIKASNATPADEFGFSLALSADGATLAVGSNRKAADVTAGGVPMNIGAAYVFVRLAAFGSAWQQQATLRASNAEHQDLFATSLALNADGSVLAVGAIGEDGARSGVNPPQSSNDAVEAGATYIFVRGGAAQGKTSWPQQSYLKASNASAGDAFGRSVALSANGNTLAVGAAAVDPTAVDGLAHSHAVYLY